jgi:hypothetical protein
MSMMLAPFETSACAALIAKEIVRRLAPEGYVGAARALVARVLRQSSS